MPNPVAITVSAPESETALLARARELGGTTVQAAAERLNLVPPADLSRHKGWLGQLVEKALGAEGGSRAGPDFARLGVELKTLPILSGCKPAESTFVCTVRLGLVADMEWKDSLVESKLSRVLWIPVEADKAVPLSQRRFGSPLLWSPSREEEAVLRADWEDLIARIAIGETGSITAHSGKWLQVRPKAAHGRTTRRAINEAGAAYTANPKGFYLRTAFTQRLLDTHYLMVNAAPQT